MFCSFGVFLLRVGNQGGARHEAGLHMSRASMWTCLKSSNPIQSMMFPVGYFSTTTNGRLWKHVVCASTHYTLNEFLSHAPGQIYALYVYVEDRRFHTDGTLSRTVFVKAAQKGWGGGGGGLLKSLRDPPTSVGCKGF